MRSTLAVGILVAVASAPAQAFEYFDGRLQVHGSFEQQVRLLDKSFNDQLDLAAWQHVLGIEMEYDFAPDGWGPFDVLSSFVRLEVRYDCVYTRACGLSSAANAFGNRARDLPGVKTSGRSSGLVGVMQVGDQSSGPFNPRTLDFRIHGQNPQPVVDGRAEAGQDIEDPIIAEQTFRNRHKPARLDQLPGFGGLFVVRGANQKFERGGDDPAFFVFSEQMDCKFGVRRFPGGANGIGTQIIGPINPKCDANERGALAGKPNLFNPLEVNPILVNPDLQGIGIAPVGSGEQPGRPAAEFALGTLQGGGGTEGTGLFLPSAGFQRTQRTRNLDSPKQNFSEGQLAWNRGDSQGWERELKEAYFDMEFFDSRLWVRAGRQSIVWGKTELFRTTDQFNPQDLALASLPSLEESRIALWSVRGVWSFYDVGPAEDVRLEVAANIDQFKPADIGQCGEPFTALVACNKRLGLFADGLVGFGLAGEDRPDSPWQDLEGLEFGARVEFRLGRFSFQVSDFVGFEDLPYADIIATFERRVDPNTGRPLKAFAKGPCTTGSESACLPIRNRVNPDGTSALNPDGATNRSPDNLPGSVVDTDFRGEVLGDLAPNLQLFTMICATSIGFSDLDPSACGQSVFNSFNNPLSGLPLVDPEGFTQRAVGKQEGILTIASLLSNALAGNPRARSVFAIPAPTGPGATQLPFVPLNVDPCDSLLADGNGGCAGASRTPHPFFAPSGPTLNQTLTDEQEALLGCGVFFGNDCEVDGIDLLHAEASFLLQSFPGINGSYTQAFRDSGYRDWFIGITDGAGNVAAQPGTEGFGQSDPATRPVDGRLVQIPGSRGPASPDFNPLQDGCPGPTAPGCAGANALVIPAAFGPAAGQQFKSEGAALSFNLLMTLVANSARPDNSVTAEKNEFDSSGFAPDGSPIPGNQFAFFDPNDPSTAGDRGQCSFLQPQFCSAVQAFFAISGVQRNTVKAGGGPYGRQDFTWHSGGQAILRYTKRNVLGFSFDFAEDVTKSNWGTELTWISRQRFANNDQTDGVTESGTINLTVSVDRPTFINFLNQNRTFFFNSQWFFQYVTDYDKGFTSNGPYNILGTFTIQTGYYQDRLLPGVTFVYDQRSESGAALTSIGYRFTENLSGTVGMNFFWGRFQNNDIPVQPIGVVGTQVGNDAFKQGVENGLSVVRERDELFMRLRYTF